MLVNNFILNTTDFLNKFTSLCEQKLSNVSQQVQRVEVVLALLEAKLDSVEWMGSGGAAPAAAAAAPSAPAITSSSAPAAPPMDAAAPAPPAAPVSEGIRLKEDPRYSKYFKMLAMGVPKPAIKLKMQSEGCPDPSQIDNDPDGPAPPGAELAPSQALVVIETGDGSDSESSENMSDDEGN